MSSTGVRSHEHAERFAATAEELFDLLIRPSAIRAWWGASRALVLARPEGLWMAAWGEDEDDPDYLTAARIAVFERPRRLVLADYLYRAKAGPLPFEADFVTTFEIEEASGGASLRVRQEGFPPEAAADDFLAACERGWRETFAGIRRFLESR